MDFATGVSGNSRSRPFPGIPASHSRSRKLGMIFSFPFPFPKVGNAIFHSRSRSQILGMQFSIPVPVTGNGLSKSGIRTGIEFKRWENEGFELIKYIFLKSTHICRFAHHSGVSIPHYFRRNLLRKNSYFELIL